MSNSIANLLNLCILTWHMIFWTDCLPLPLSEINENVQSDLILADSRYLGKIGTRTGKSFGKKFNRDINKLHAGGSVDLFYRYGFFSLSVRVVPRNDPGMWLVREPTANIFEPSTMIEKRSIVSNKFDPQFKIFVCDDVQELKQAYFQDFKAEGVDQPHRLYTGSWRDATMAKYLGINKEALNGDYGFVMIKLVKHRITIEVSNSGQNSALQPKLVPSAAAKANVIRKGDTESVLDFVHKFGSHYISQMEIGDTVFQVFVLTKKQLESLKETIKNDDQNIDELYQRYLTPWMVHYTGLVRAASGDKELTKFLESELRVNGLESSYPSIMQLESNPQLVETLEVLTTDTSAVVGMSFSSLSSQIPNVSARTFFDEVVKNTISLWEVNIR